MERILSNQCKDYINKKVVLFGYVHNIRKLGGLVFIILRDKSGIVQTIIEKPDEVISSLGLESVVKISGRVREEKRAPNGIEVEIEKLEPIVLVKEQIPIEINKPIEYSKVSLDKILSYRSVTLRNLQIRAIFKIQAGLAEAFRKFLNSEGFTEVFTPKIVKTATEGGAELFPVRYFEKRAYLAQSPQFYKQIMVGVFEKVFEVGYVFRAEKHETKRHLNEYVSLDAEVGFIKDEEDLMELHTRLLRYMFNYIRENFLEELEMYNIKLPKIDKIPRVSFSEAINILRKKYKKSCEGDLDPEGERLICKYFKEETDSDLVFITLYPREKSPMYAMPYQENPKLARKFDLLYKGVEITTGGQRIHDYKMLKKSIKERGLNPEDFSFYLQAFRYGMPPHGGFGIGLERLTCQMLELRNVKEASLFPRDRHRLVP